MIVHTSIKWNVFLMNIFRVQKSIAHPRFNANFVKSRWVHLHILLLTLVALAGVLCTSNLMETYIRV